MKIAIYSPKCENVGYELITKAYELSKNEEHTIEAIVISDSIEQDDIEKMYRAGADRVVLIKAGGEFNQVNYSKAFIQYFNQNKSDILLFPATIKGRILAPRITSMLDTGLTADCIELEMIIKNNEQKLASTRPTFGAELMATILSKKSPQCATIHPGIFEAKFENDKRGEFIEFNPQTEEKEYPRIIKKTKKENKPYFEDAEIILAAGFGLYNGKDNIYIQKLEDLANKMNAKLALSRKLIDYGIKDTTFQIGQTGATVSPDVYIAFGISGALQHVSGMKNSKTIIAINNDPNADIFKYSDYKIVDDAKKVIDELLNHYS